MRSSTALHSHHRCVRQRRATNLTIKPIKPELSGGCMLKKYAAFPRCEIDAVRNHGFNF
jgi:hypothetical protein